jgi:transcriptional regulator of arginine metabolism
MQRAAVNRPGASRSSLVTRMSPSKASRQQAIRDIVQLQPVASQEELRALLQARGIDVTQSTLSRDISELGLARVAGEHGAVWAVLDRSRPAAVGDEPALRSLLPQLFVSVEGTGALAVLKTLRGSAQPIAEALDAEHWPDILGTIAGDDTILIIARSDTARIRVERELRQRANVATTRTLSPARTRRAG